MIVTKPDSIAAGQKIPLTICSVKSFACHFTVALFHIIVSVTYDKKKSCFIVVGTFHMPNKFDCFYFSRNYTYTLIFI